MSIHILFNLVWNNYALLVVELSGKGGGNQVQYSDINEYTILWGFKLHAVWT